jgi:hypothetical protein
LPLISYTEDEEDKPVEQKPETNKERNQELDFASGEILPVDDNNNESDGTAPKVMTSSAEAEATPKTEINLLLFYEFDFSQTSWEALYRDPNSVLSCSELSELKSDMAKFRNAEMAGKTKFALETSMIGFDFEDMLWDRVSEDFI